jgi:hypothetical protein
MKSGGFPSLRLITQKRKSDAIIPNIMKEKLRMTMILSGGFSLTFLTFITLESLMITLMRGRSKLSKETGFASLSVVYIAFAVSSITSHAVCERIELKGLCCTQYGRGSWQLFSD